MFGTADGDSLTGGELFGGAGDDVLQGRRIHFGRGDGADTLVPDPAANPTAPPTRVVELAPGLAVEDLEISRAEDDLVIAIRGTGDRLTVRDHFALEQVSLFGPPTTPAAIAGLRLADGTFVGPDGINALAYATGPRNDDAVNAAAGGEGDDRIRLVGASMDVHGGDGADRIEADPRLYYDVSRLFGDSGDDRLAASRGFYAETRLDGGSGDDVLLGAGSATLIGGSGHNRLTIGTGPADNAFAEPGNGGSLPALPAGSRPQQVVLERAGGVDLVTQQDASLGAERHDAFAVRMVAADYRDLTIGRDNQDLILGVRGRTAAMTIPDFFVDGNGHAGLQGVLVADELFGLEYLARSSPDASALAARAQPVAAAPVERVGTATGDDLVGAGGADHLSGMGGDDRIDGLSGDDTLSGGGGDDVLVGRSGDDTLRGEAGDDTLFGGFGDDRLEGGDGADRLTDVAGANVLEGGAGADSLRAEGGHNALRGGDGNDQIVAVAGTNAVDAGAGDDWISFVGGSADIDGGAGDDRIHLSGAGTVTLRFGRGAGRDRVDGSTGGFGAGVEAEVLFGPGVAPSDVEVARQWNAGLQADDVLLTIAGTTDQLTIAGAIREGVPALQTLRFDSGETLRVSDLLAQPRSGSAGSDTLVGTAGNDVLFGNGGNDRLQGLSGDDRLDGGTGADFLEGGAGNDVYVVDDRNDVVAESDALGRDSGGLDEVYTSVSMIMPFFVERLTMTGSDPLFAWGWEGSDVIVGNAGDNGLYGRGGADRMVGRAGNDAYAVDDAGDVVVEAPGEGHDVVFATVSHVLADNVEDLWLSGGAGLEGGGNALANALHGGPGADLLHGHGGDDLLDGAAGADTMHGGAGDDLYLVDDPADVIVEAVDEGVDSVQSWVSMALPSGVENLQLLDSAGGSATGNALDNRLVGNVGNDRLDGGAGADTLEGGRGTDTYVLRAGGGVDHVHDIPVGDDVAVVAVAAGLGPGDVRIDRDDSDGRPTLVVSLRDGSAALRFVDFGDRPYDLVVQFADGGLWDSVTVRAKVDAIEGTPGNDVLVGSPGADRITGLDGDGALEGGDGDDALDGGDGADTLDGGSGADVLQGGAGDDRYLQVGTDDTVVEQDGGGDDTLEAAVGLTLPAGVEALVLTGNAAIDGAGNDLGNRLVGNASANVLDGGFGADLTEGGAGDDIHVVDDIGDLVEEWFGEGDDTVLAAVSYVLPADVERLALQGVAANGTGNALANALAGNNGANTLAGGAGADTINTGGGADVIAFNRGGGADVVNASAGADDTLTLGGGMGYADLRLRKPGLDLVQDAGAGDQITFRNWYETGVNRKSVVTLQAVTDAMAGYNPAGNDRMLNRRVARSDFAGLVGRFDAARAADPALSSYAVAGALADFYLAGSDTAAIGGDLAYEYGHRNALTDIGVGAAQATLAAAGFATSAQTLQAASTLYAGTQRLR